MFHNIISSPAPHFSTFSCACIHASACVLVYLRANNVYVLCNGLAGNKVYAWSFVGVGFFFFLSLSNGFLSHAIFSSDLVYTTSRQNTPAAADVPREGPRAERRLWWRQAYRQTAISPISRPPATDEWRQPLGPRAGCATGWRWCLRSASIIPSILPAKSALVRLNTVVVRKLRTCLTTNII